MTRYLATFFSSCILASCSAGNSQEAYCSKNPYVAEYKGKDGAEYIFQFSDNGEDITFNIRSPAKPEDITIRKTGILSKNGYEISEFLIIPRKWNKEREWSSGALKCKSEDGEYEYNRNRILFSCIYNNNLAPDKFLISKDRGIVKIIFGSISDPEKGSAILTSQKGISAPCP